MMIFWNIGIAVWTWFEVSFNLMVLYKVSLFSKTVLFMTKPLFRRTEDVLRIMHITVPLRAATSEELVCFVFFHHFIPRIVLLLKCQIIMMFSKIKQIVVRTTADVKACAIVENIFSEKRPLGFRLLHCLIRNTIKKQRSKITFGTIIICYSVSFYCN